MWFVFKGQTLLRVFPSWVAAFVLIYTAFLSGLPWWVFAALVFASFSEVVSVAFLGQRPFRHLTVKAPYAVSLASAKVAKSVGLWRSPKVRVVHVPLGSFSSSSVNAGAVDSLAWGTTVVVSSAALSQFSVQQLKGVFAHEAAHLVAWHPLIQVFTRFVLHAAAFSWLALLCLFLLPTDFFNVSSYVLWVSPFVFLYALLEPNRVSRLLEFHADAIAVRTDPLYGVFLSDALLTVFRAGLVSNGQVASIHEASKFVPGSLSFRGVKGFFRFVQFLFSSHPSFEARLSRLQKFSS